MLGAAPVGGSGRSQSRGKSAVPGRGGRGVSRRRRRGRARTPAAGSTSPRCRAPQLADLIQQLNEQMLHAARELQFEVAARLRDEIARAEEGTARHGRRRRGPSSGAPASRSPSTPPTRGARPVLGAGAGLRRAAAAARVSTTGTPSSTRSATGRRPRHQADAMVDPHGVGPRLSSRRCRRARAPRTGCISTSTSAPASRRTSGAPCASAPTSWSRSAPPSCATADELRRVLDRHAGPRRQRVLHPVARRPAAPSRL